MSYQSSGHFSAIWDRGDAYLSHSFLNPEISQFIVFKLIWPSDGTFNNIITDTSAPTFAAATLSVHL